MMPSPDDMVPRGPWIELVRDDRPRKYSHPRWQCPFVRAYRSGASGWLGQCCKPATHAVRAIEGGVVPFCLRHATAASKAGGVRL